MFRYLSALAAVVMLAAGTHAADKKLTIRWHGQSFFEIVSSEGTRIVTDPHAIEAFGRQLVSADIVTISHPHSDHNRLDVIENRDKDKDKIKILNGIKEEGKRYAWNTVDEKVKGIRIYSVGTFHDNMQGMKRGLNSVMVIEVDGFRIAHLGDLGHKLSANQLKAIGQVDILMIPVGGIYTLNGSEAKEVVEQIKPRYAILPMHYGIKMQYEDLLTADEFLDEQDNVREGHPAEYTLEVGAKPPEKPQIVLLAWTDKK